MRLVRRIILTRQIPLFLFKYYYLQERRGMVLLHTFLLLNKAPNDNTVACLLKARTVKLLRNNSVNTPFARQWLCTRHVIAATDTHATTEELLKAMVSVRSLPVVIPRSNCRGLYWGFLQSLKSKLKKSPIQASPLPEGLAGTAWEASKLPNYVSITPPSKTVVSHYPPAPTFFFSLSLSLSLYHQ
jgi:hypothetical protein